MFGKITLFSCVYFKYNNKEGLFVGMHGVLCVFLLFLLFFHLEEKQDFVGGVAGKGKRRSGGSIRMIDFANLWTSYQSISKGFTNRGY